jgi:hypothetical protein
MTHHHPQQATPHGEIQEHFGHTERVQAPELNPGEGLGALLLFVGILAVILGRRG